MTRDGERLLFVNRRSPDGNAHPFVGIDNVAAGCDVAEWFVTRGVPVAGVIHGGRHSSATADRVHGFRAALAAAGLALDDARVRTIDTHDHMRIGYAAGASLAGARAVAGDDAGRRGLFCSSDLIAYGAHRALTEAGWRVPEDVTLVGFDDNPLSDWIAPWLTSVRVPYEAFGAAVVAALEDMWAARPPRATLLPHRLVVRPTG